MVNDMEKEQQRGPGAKTQVTLFSPRDFNEVEKIALQFNQKVIVVLNFETCMSETVRRILDFLSGALFMINGNIYAVSSRTFLLIPSDVDFTNDALSGLDDGEFLSC